MNGPSSTIPEAMEVLGVTHDRQMLVSHQLRAAGQ